MPLTEETVRQLQAATLKLMDSRSMTEAGEVIHAHAGVLLQPDADAFYDLLRQHHPESIVLIEMRLDLVERCREGDITAALAEYEPLFDLWAAIVRARADRSSSGAPTSEIVQLCEEALDRVRHRRVHPPRVCGWLLTVLAEALLETSSGSRVDNIEMALIHLRTCVDWVPALSDFQQAEAYRLLGDAHRHRVLGNAGENRSSARDAYERAITFLEQQPPKMRARIESRLIACCPPTTVQQDALDWLTGHMRAALSVFSATQYPREHALTKLAFLGELAANASENSREMVLGKYEDAILELPADAPVDAAEAWTTLAQEVRRSASSKEDWDRCRRCATMALSRMEARDLPRARREALGLHATALYHLGDFENALRLFDEAAALSEGLLESAYTASAVRIEAAATGDVHRGAAWCLLRLERYEEAALRHERGRARTLEETLSAAEVSSSTLGAADKEAFETAHLAWNAWVKRAGYSSLDRDRDPLVLRRCRVLRAALVEQRRTLQMGEWLRPQTFADVRALVPKGGALVSFMVSNRESAVFLVPDRAESINREHVITLGERGSGPHAEAGLQTAGLAWMQSYAEDWWMQNDTSRWMDDVERHTGHLWELVMGAVCEKLQQLGVPEGAPVVLLPSGALHNVPLHAAWRTVDGRRRPFLVDYSVSYAPSLALLKVSRQRADDPARRAHTLVLVRDPTNSLPFASAESVSIERRFPDEGVSVHGSELDLPRLWSDLRTAGFVHLACHAAFGTEPDLAALNLGTMKPVTVSDIRDFWYLERARLVTLSACETGLGSVIELANETTGMVEALFGVGASTLVASLWAVDDVATFLLMDELYRSMLEDGLTPPAALTAAQRWLFTATPEDLDERLQMSVERTDAWPHHAYAHPYYWAAFRCTGL